MQTHFCKLVCASFPCWVDFSCSHLRGLQLTPIQSSAKKFSKSWWKKMPVGVSGEKKREELRDMWHRLRSLRMKRHFMYRASFRAEWLHRFRLRAATVRGSDAQMAGCCSTRWGWQAGARKSPWPRGPSARIVAAAARIQGQEGKRGVWKAFLLSLKRSPKGVCAVRGGGGVGARMNLGIRNMDPSDSASRSFPLPPLTLFHFFS